MAQVPETPRRSRTRTGHNPDLHSHLDNSSGGRLSAKAIFDLSTVGSSTTDHHLLLNLTTFDDHPQYFYLAGRATPQQGFFGTGAGASTGFLSSTASATKGKYGLNAAGTMVVDEANTLLGVGIAVPTAGIHVVANPNASGSGVVANSDVSVGQWGRGSGATFGTFGPSPFPGTDWQNVNTNDGTASYLIRDAHTGGAFNDICGLTTTITGAANIVTVNGFRLPGGSTVPADPTTFFQIELTMNNGDRYRTDAISWNVFGSSPTDVIMPAYIFAGTGGPNHNSITFTANVTTGKETETYLCISYAVINAAGASAVARFKNSVASTAKNTEWINESDVVVGSVTTTGQAQFQNVALEDPGVGTNTIVNKAPTSPTTHNLIWPGLPVAGGLLTVSTYAAPDATLAWSSGATLATRIQHRWEANGPFTVDTDVDGAYIALHAFSLTQTRLWRRLAGTAGSTTVVLRQNGTVIDTRTVTAAAGNNAVNTSGVLAIAVALGDRLTIDATSIETGRPIANGYGFEFEGN